VLVNTQLVRELLIPFFTALGVVLGGSIVGSFACLFTTGSPFGIMASLAKGIRLWGVVTAMGGSFHTIRIIESGIFRGEPAALLQQFTAILLGLAGASAGCWIILTITGGD